MIPLNSDFSLLSLNDKNCFNETDNQITGLPVDRRNSLLATTECSNHLFWQGQLQLALLIRDHCVHIQVLQARYLQVPVDEGYGMFVEIRIAPKYAPQSTTYQLRTKSVPDCTSPVFNEKFSFEISHVTHSHRLYIELYLNQSKFGYENAILLGGMSFDVRRLRKKSEKSTELLCYQAEKSVNLFKSSLSHNLHSQKSNFEYFTTERSSINIPSLANTDNFPKPQWYYLLGQSSCYRRHMSVATVPSSSKCGKPDTFLFQGSLKYHSESLTSEVTNVIIPSESLSTLSSLHISDEQNSPASQTECFKRLQITIPKSESGYGFTLATQMMLLISTNLKVPHLHHLHTKIHYPVKSLVAYLLTDYFVFIL
ncbi:unnamed protein product [Heterobilharzia americana]|nr:unnamed protein product [Heterobilharzia americana]